MPLATPDIALESDLMLDMPYDVVLHNDDVNTIDYVVVCLVQVIGVGTKKAGMLALDVHENGEAVVWNGPHDEAVRIARTLQSLALTATCRKSR